MEEHRKKIKCEIWNDSMQNWKSKPIQKAQLIIADVPYNVGTQFYGSNPVWYNGGIIKTEKANSQEKRLLHLISILISMNIFTFAHSLCGRNRQKALQGVEARMRRA